MLTVSAAALTAAHLGRAVTVGTASPPASGSLVALDVTPGSVTVTLSTRSGGRAIVDLRPDTPVALAPCQGAPKWVLAADLAGCHLGRAVDFGGLSRSHTGVLTGFQAERDDAGLVTLILDSGRWFEVDPDCVLAFF
ncbi:MAG: hypothetical protein DI630_31435 [Gordonia sp. (in: high G+C Gram-positive bacteria)]|nr:MAG: hypothetical protein DI630_31435 [Gordonia sp. (in: high G+C Gram-positive bacteria)]